MYGLKDLEKERKAVARDTASGEHKSIESCALKESIDLA